MIKKYSFSVDAWLEIEIEGKSENDCDEQLRTASLSDLVENGYVKSFDISEIDDSVLEKRVKVKVYNINWDMQNTFDLPTSTTIDIDIYKDKNSETIDEIDERNAIEDELDFIYDIKPASYDYEIIETK